MVVLLVEEAFVLKKLVEVLLRIIPLLEKIFVDVLLVVVRLNIVADATVKSEIVVVANVVVPATVKRFVTVEVPAVRSMKLPFRVPKVVVKKFVVVALSITA